MNGKLNFDMIDHERSILLCAPTSSGKTFLTNYLIKRSNKFYLLFQQCR